MALNANVTDRYGVENTLTERQWAKLAPMLGQEYCVGGNLQLRCSATTGKLSTTIASGRAQAYGFGADFNTQEVAHPIMTAGTGQSRWDLVAIRFDWTPDAGNGGGDAYPVVIPGPVQATAPSDLPAVRQQTPGQQFDLPLAFARVEGGSAQVQSYIDLRRMSPPIVARDRRTVPSADRADGEIVFEMGRMAFWNSSLGRWITPMSKLYADTITAWSSSTVAKTPHNGRLLAQVTIPDPGYPYLVTTSAQFELDPLARTRVWTQYAASASATSWTEMYSMYYTDRGYSQTKVMPPQTIRRTGSTVINLLAHIPDAITTTGAAWSTSAYNGKFQALVIPE